MLETIHIKNFAIIDEKTVSFSKGFNVLSGETGAGKSILIDALGLQLGDRGDNGFIRQGQSRCDIQSEFSIEQTRDCHQWLVDNEFDEDKNCLLRRTLSTDGKSKCYINGIATTVSQTKLLGEMLVDIHGQHAHQSLLHPEKQLALLDNFADSRDLLVQVRNSYFKLKELLDKQQMLQFGSSQNTQNGQNIDGSEAFKDKLELLTYQCEELDDLDLTKNEFNELVQQQKSLASGTEILNEAGKITSYLENDDTSLIDIISHLQNSAQKIQRLDENNDNINNITQLCEQLEIYTTELKSAINHFVDNIEIDPDRLEQVESRMEKLHDIARKHHVSPEDLPDFSVELKARLTNLNEQLASLETLAEDINKAKTNYQKHADKLSQHRQNKAINLSQSIVEKLSELGIKNAKFSIDFTKSTNPTATGNDKIVFMFSPNIGQDQRPMHKIASGGELSRISLAIQVASLNNKSEATLIFDEVDSGIGGATAEVVGRMLKTLSTYNQVICVTHLAQVAVFADRHILIEKTEENNQTVTGFKVLDKNNQVNEIARMSGGLELDNKTLDYAKSMLDNANKFSQSLIQIKHS